MMRLNSLIMLESINWSSKDILGNILKDGFENRGINIYGIFDLEVHNF